MEIIGSLILFILFVFVYLIIVEIFVMLFRITGLSDEKARFQVISMLTNSGYTTEEAELITENRSRRKLARFVMMFGYAFTVTIVSTVVNIFIQFREDFTGGAVAAIPFIAFILVISWFVKKSRWTNRMADKVIRKVGSKFLYNEKSNPIIIVDKHRDFVIARIFLNIMPKELTDVMLKDSNIKTLHGINVLLKGDEPATAETIFNVGDTIVVMGNESEVRKMFSL